MRKTLLLAMMVMATVVGNAQQVFKTYKPTKSSKSLRQSAPRKADGIDGTIVWGYYTGDENGLTALGTQKAGTFRVAIFVPGDGALKGAKIQGINLPAQTSKMSNVSVFGGTVLGNSDLFTKNVSSVVVGYNKITLDNPVDIPEKGMYVGYEFTTSSANTQGEKFPIATAAVTEVAGSLYLSTSPTDPMQDFSGQKYGVSALQIFVSNANIPNNGVIIKGVTCNHVAINTKGAVNVSLMSDAKNPTNNIGYKLTVNGVESTGTVNLTTAIPAGFNQSGTATIEFDAPGETGTFPCSLAITKVNGVDNENGSDATAFEMSTLSRVVPRLTVVEEFTGVNCPWCPRGWVGMEMVKHDMADKAVVIAWHKFANDVSDPMYVSTYANGIFTGSAPDCAIDRRIMNIDPFEGENGMGIEATVNKCNAIAPTVDIKVTAQYDDENNKRVKAKAETEFLANAEDYSIAFVLTADNLSGTTNEWRQANNYAGISSAGQPAGIADFCSGGKYGSKYVFLTFNDVLIASTYVSGRTSIPKFKAKVTGDKETTEATVAMPIKSTLVSAIKANEYKDVFLTAIVTDKNGTIVNAARCRVEFATPTAIRNTTDEVTEVERFTIDGKKVTNNVPGINIIKMSDGSVKKVVVK